MRRIRNLDLAIGATTVLFSVWWQPALLATNLVPTNLMAAPGDLMLAKFPVGTCMTKTCYLVEPISDQERANLPSADGWLRNEAAFWAMSIPLRTRTGAAYRVRTIPLHGSTAETSSRALSDKTRGAVPLGCSRK